MDLAELSDRAEIADVIARYTLAVDTQDWDLLDTVFTADARIDYTESGGIEGDLPTVKAWLAQNLPAFSARYLHTLGQVCFPAEGLGSAAVSDSGVRGGGAPVSAYFHNPMVIADGRTGEERVVEVGGIYRHTFVRTPEGWRSSRLHEQVVWTRGF